MIGENIHNLTICNFASRRSVLVREAAVKGGPTEVITPDGFNVRTLVHEYYEGAFTASGNIIVFSNYKDQRLYKQSVKGGTCFPSLFDFCLL